MHPNGEVNRKVKEQFDDGRRRKRKMRYQRQVFDAPRRQIVVHEIGIRRLALANRLHHDPVSAVADEGDAGLNGDADEGEIALIRLFFHFGTKKRSRIVYTAFLLVLGRKNPPCGAAQWHSFFFE